MSVVASMITIASTNPVQMDIDIQDTNVFPQPKSARYQVEYSNSDALDPFDLTYTAFGSIQNLPLGDLNTGISFRYTAPTALPAGFYWFRVVVYDMGNNLLYEIYDQAGPIFLSGGGGSPVCLVKGTHILTPSGYKCIETLKKGDLVTTESKQVPIMNIHSIHYEKTTKLSAPYTIYKNALGSMCPPNDIKVSGRHAIQLRPGVWEIPQEGAKVNKNIIQDTLGDSVTYYHIELPDYAKDNLIANGQIVESLNSGKYKESYVWDAKENGYKRTLIKRTTMITKV
jgi:hypothetical protein